MQLLTTRPQILGQRDIGAWRIYRHTPHQEVCAFRLYYDPAQCAGAIGGHALRSKLRESGLRFGNVTDLDRFLENPALIPPEWHGMQVCFWDTLYEGNGEFAVRALYERCPGQWDSYLHELGNDFGRYDPAAVF
jgi:hypothetical protein